MHTKTENQQDGLEMPLRPEWSISKSDIDDILENSTYHPTGSEGGLFPIEVQFKELEASEENGVRELLSLTDSSQQAARWCQDVVAFLRADSSNSGLDDHVEKIDAMFSGFVKCSFLLHTREQRREDVLDKGCALLARLPAYPPELEFVYGKDKQLDSSWPAGYFCISSDEKGLDDKVYSWSNLRVLSRPATSVVRIALRLVMEKINAFTLTADYTDTVAGLLDAATELARGSSNETDARALFILQAFLWAAWQQTVMLQLWYDTHTETKVGYRFEDRFRIASKRIPSAMPKWETDDLLRPQYMCKWAFELFRSDLSSVARDFRKFFALYVARFGDRPPRCNLKTNDGIQRLCDGKAPGNCQRFDSVGVKIQSAHDYTCSGFCHQLVWDQESYMSIPGARAVCLDTTDEKSIRYCAVSSETMAISHVWSHGQGGRPEWGFNHCLHRRYATLARSFGCTSYWMDTPCIPEDDDLRDEAIKHINDNFQKSKVTLLVDRDLQDLEISPLTILAEETILATLVVCDWNVRAWTLLEGMQGRLDLQLLCKDNEVISLMTVIMDVLVSGSLDIVSSCLNLQHFTPYRPDKWKHDTPELITTEQATSLLNHRHATKDRDVIMIWGLVCGSSAITKTAVDFWKSREGALLATGFLMSSAPRIQGNRGLSWAPARPNLLPPTSTDRRKRFPAFDGENSANGSITPAGFVAPWLVCTIRRSRILPAWPIVYHTVNSTKLMAYAWLNNQGARLDFWGILHLRSIIAPVFKRYRWVSLLQPALRDRYATGYMTPPRPAQYQGNVDGVLLAVVASNDEENWEWQFVHEWDTKHALPEFILEEKFLIV